MTSRSLTPSVLHPQTRPGERARDVLRHAERLADLAHGAPRAVAAHDRRQGRAVPAIGVVDPLDHLFPALVLEVDVDVGRLAPLLARRSARTGVRIGPDRSR